jgi:hypothetical protein
MQIGHGFSRYPEDPQPYPYMSELPSRTVDTTRPTGENLRAALILDRYTRSLTIKSATIKAGQILGIQPAYLKDMSFYDCIHDNSLIHAEECLDNAKSNDSIVHLEFCSRDDVQDDMEARQDFQAADPARLWNLGNRQPIPPLELEAIVFSTSDGLLVVLQRKLAIITSPVGKRELRAKNI